MTTDDDRRREFEALYRATLSPVRAFVRRRASESVVDDVVAQTFLTAWRRCDDAVAGGLPWLYRTARLTLQNAERSERRRDHLRQRIATVTAVARDDESDAVANRSIVADALCRLGDDDREVLMLAYWEHLPIKAIATVLECRPGTAAVRLHRARHRLRDVLSDPPAAVPAQVGLRIFEVPS